MRSALSGLEVVRPRRLADALASLGEQSGPRPIPLAGGTDLFVYLNAGTQTGARYLDLWGLRELGGIRAGPRSVSLGALTTFTEIRAHPASRRLFPALVAAAAEVGARQIQNRATVAGNIANASPAADSLPALLALEAVVHARSLRGARAVPLDGLYLGYRKLALAADELIVAVELPRPAPRTFQFFRKVGTRRAQSIAKVVFGGTLALGRNGRIEQARIAYGSMAPVPLRARHAEAALEGAPLAQTSVSTAVAELGRDLSPIDDIRSDHAYRQQVAEALLRQFLSEAAAALRRRL